jgi:hypothetical protein
MRWASWVLVYVAACSGSVADSEGRVFGEQSEIDVEIGFPCVPLSEGDADFGGFDTSEITLEWGHPTCGQGACLINRFQGRVTCPEGQPGPNAGAPECSIESGEPVTRSVCAQCPERPAALAVQCSCRCAPLAGEEPDPGETYCSCPGGFACRQLVSLGIDAGGYCVPESFPVDPHACGTLSGFWAPQCDGVPSP